MIIGANTLLKDAIITLSLRNLFLIIGKIGCEGPSNVLEDLEHWFEFVISTDFHDWKAGLLITLVQIQPEMQHCRAILNILGCCSSERHTIDVHYVNIEAYITLGIM